MELCIFSLQLSLVAIPLPCGLLLFLQVKGDKPKDEYSHRIGCNHGKCHIGYQCYCLGKWSAEQQYKAHVDPLDNDCGCHTNSKSRDLSPVGEVDQPGNEPGE
ncbi:MAG: hypothetical protein A4E42_00116 [Methanoregulaceae archaeon PtaU1.Bin222]|nr:MAG: hypothetical protein A4E42_00116 [Methanoregulaceae archaeon PtaU1.Bin222]